MLASVFPGLDGELLGDLADRCAAVSQRAGEQDHVLVDDLRPAAVVSLARCNLLTFEGLLADVVAVELGGDRAHGEKHGAHAVRVVDPGLWPGEERSEEHTSELQSLAY